MPFTVVLDACVLYPAPLRDLLLELATAQLFRARWTDRIHDEWIRNLLRQRPDLTLARLERTRDLMNTHAADCLVEGYEYLIPSLRLPDPDDRHVVAAAIHSRCDAIVTYNLRHFPGEALRPYNLEAIHPDEFINFQRDLSPAGVLSAVHAVRKRLRNPPISAEGYLTILQQCGLPKTVASLSPFIIML